MPLSTRRWRIALVAIAATALAATLLATGDDPDAMSEWWSARVDARRRVQRVLARALQREGALALREALYATARSTRLPSGAQSTGGPSLRVIAMDSVATRFLPTVREIVDREWSALGTSARDTAAPRRPRVEVLLVGEVPSSIPQRFASATRDASVGRFVLVPRTEGEPCSVIIALRRAASELLEQQLASGDGILGPCGFVAAFGLPNRGLRSVLDSIGWRAAAFASWGSPALGTDSLRPAWSELSAPAVRCLTTADGACDDAWRDLNSNRDDDGERRALPPGDSRVWDVTRLSWFAAGGTSLGAREGFLVSDLAQASDGASFGEAWRTSASMQELVQRSVGTRGDAWLSRWLAREYRAPDVSPLPTAREITWTGMLGAMAALVIALAPRVRRRSVARR